MPSPYWDGGTGVFLCACLGRQLESVTVGEYPGCCISTFIQSVRARLTSWGGAGREAVLQSVPNTVIQGKAGCPIRKPSDPEGNALQLSIPHNLVVENPIYKYRVLLAGLIRKKVVIIK